jgi:hypothetical protein
MKQFFVLLFVPLFSMGQKSPETSFRNGSIALGSWSVINMTVAAASVKNADGQALHFHQMNGYWNVINGSIAAYSLISPYFSQKKSVSEPEQARKYKQIFLINAGLDAIYITSGGLLNYFSGSKNPERNQGFGTSFMLQGGFLLAYDLWMANRMNRWMDFKNQGRFYISPAPYGINLSYRFE